MLGTPVDLNQLTTDAYVVAGIADHISPWQACYRSARLLGIKNLRFVLSSSGHIASLVNPPGNPRANFRLGGVDEPDPEFWLESAEQHTDSWWPDFVSWLGERSGRKRTPQSPWVARAWFRWNLPPALMCWNANYREALYDNRFRRAGRSDQARRLVAWCHGLDRGNPGPSRPFRRGHRRSPVDPHRPAAGGEGTVQGTIAHGYLTLSLAPAVISQVLQIRELTAALNYGLNKVRFPTPLPVGSQVRAAVTVTSAEQKTSGVESVFTLTYEIDGEERPACVADVIVLYP